MFGFAWGYELSDGSGWKFHSYLVDEIDSRVQREIDADTGAIGSDDLDIADDSKTWMCRICHEGDLHVFYTEADTIVNGLYELWQQRKLEPAIHLVQGSI